MLLLKRLGIGTWEVLARPARQLKVGSRVLLAGGLAVEVTATAEEGIRSVRVVGADGDPDAALLALGSTPLPPYIRGWVGDPERYQTIYADRDGSAAAPTAGLHFTEQLLGRLAESGIGLAHVVLHVGLDTFRPMTVEDPADHHLHQEWYEVPATTVAAIEDTRARGNRVVAVGTTSVRALESWAASREAEGWTSLFVLPGHQFMVVDALVTNFHLPRSTLLMLVSALAGRDRIVAAYDEAVKERYRFFSFGDAMLIL
jgi:S-adenosylmethionine:tRNA ribosyltransferase-isomerase